MRYNKVKEFVGKRVEIEFFDGDIFVGTLGYKDGWFRIEEEKINFKPSGIVSIKRIDKKGNKSA